MSVGLRGSVCAFKEEDRVCGKGQGKAAPCVFQRMRWAYKISSFPVPEGRRLHQVIFPVKGNTWMFKKQPGTIRVMIPGCSKWKRESRRSHARKMRRSVSPAQDLITQRCFRAMLHGTQLLYLRSTQTSPFLGASPKLVCYTCDPHTALCRWMRLLSFPCPALHNRPLRDWPLGASGMLHRLNMVLPVATSWSLKGDLKSGGS